MPTYIDRSTGKPYTFQTAPSAGVNVDTDGVEYYFVETSNGWIDANSGLYLQPVPAFGGGATFLLDTYPAFAAYSVRQLSSTATNCMRVRESGGDTLAVIGFSGGWVDEAALLAHCGANSGYVETWYDQSGNGLDTTQITLSYQPQIVASGVVNKLNAKPAMIPTDVRTVLESAAATFNQPNTMFTVGRMDTGDTRVIFSEGSGVSRNQLYLSGDNVTMLAGATIAQTGGGDAQKLWTTLFKTTTSLLRENGTQTASGDVSTWNPNKVTVMNFGAGTNPASFLQSHIIYNSDQTANFSAIETDINTAFGVYA